jgi:hypothetical protein
LRMNAGISGEVKGGVPITPLSDNVQNYVLNLGVPRTIVRPNGCRTVILTAMVADAWVRNASVGDAVVPEEDFSPDGNGMIGQIGLPKGATRVLSVDRDLSAVGDSSLLVAEWFE